MVARDAPGVELRLLGENPDDDKNLSRGEVDLDVGSLPDRSASIASQVIGTDEMALVVRSGHPLTAAGPTIEQFADAVHIVVSRRGRLRGPVDAVLEAHGLRRRVAAALPSFGAALAIVEALGHRVRAAAATGRPRRACAQPAPAAVPAAQRPGGGELGSTGTTATPRTNGCAASSPRSSRCAWG